MSIKDSGFEGKQCRLIEVAHGLNMRNAFISLDDLDKWIKAQPDIPGLYSSFFRYYTDDPNVGGVLAGFIMDFDAEQNPERARKEALAVIRNFMDRFDIKEQDLSICFSGNKGFHTIVNHAVFGIEPHAYLPQIFKSMAKELVQQHGLKTLDLNIYDRRRLIRLPNTRHEKSGAYKIPLTLSELERMNIDQIRALAVKPRGLIPAKMEHEVSLKAQQWYQKHRDEFMKNLEERKPVFSDADFKISEILPCVNRRLELGAQEHMRNRYTWQLASYFCKKGTTLDECLNIMREWYPKLDRGLDPYTLDEFEKTIRATYEKGGYEVGCGSEYIAELCIGKEKCPLFSGSVSRENLSPEIEAFLKDPYLHINIEKILGYKTVGESNFKMLCYYGGIGAAISKTPSGVIAVDILGTGKSHVEKMVLTGFPPERVDQPTSITDKVVNYLGSRFFGRIIRIDELYKGTAKERESEEGLPYIRVWMTEGYLEHWVTNPETRKEERIKTDGCPFFLTSTTQEVGEQLGSRNWIAHVDTSEPQTVKIHGHQRVKHALPNVLFKPEEDQEKLLVSVTRWLMENPKRVFIPFTFSFPSKDPRSRRDLPRFLQLIECVANVHQLQRKHVTIDGTEYIIAEIRDFETALAVCKDFLRSSVTTLDKYCLQIIDVMGEKFEQQWKLKEIRQRTSIKSDQTIRRKLKVLEERGYLTIEKDETGNVYLYQLTPSGVALEFEINIKITDDGSWLLPYYERMGKGEVTEELKVELLDRLYNFTNFTSILPPMKKGEPKPEVPKTVESLESCKVGITPVLPEPLGFKAPLKAEKKQEQEKSKMTCSNCNKPIGIGEPHTFYKGLPVHTRCLEGGS